MKKYFCVGTDEVVEFGDVLGLTVVKESEDSKVTVEKKVEFNEDSLGLLVEMGVIEEREVEEEPLVDFDCPHEDLLQEICNDQDSLEKRIEALEKQVRILKKMLDSVTFPERKQ